MALQQRNEGTSFGSSHHAGFSNDNIKTNRVIRNIGLVIFPDQRWIMIWDSLILVLLNFVAVVVPYTVGVSGGWRIFTNVPWMVFNIMINTTFIIDAVLYFFRAYPDHNGLLVFNLQRIRRR